MLDRDQLEREQLIVPPRAEKQWRSASRLRRDEKIRFQYTSVRIDTIDTTGISWGSKVKEIVKVREIEAITLVDKSWWTSTKILEGYFGSFLGMLVFRIFRTVMDTDSPDPLFCLGHDIHLFPFWKRKVRTTKARYDGRHGEILRHKEGHHPSAWQFVGDFQARGPLDWMDHWMSVGQSLSYERILFSLGTTVHFFLRGGLVG